ncbi:MAG TPA: RNA 2',3'-cyclic phosphodiesterase [Candidatus Limnocylindrales bacterium]|nr:RNA 2',3'-cyclic phosphodiesterase [Candidatus Limnocylindrales bacterium]
MTAEPRLFVAVPIAESARARIAEIVETIRAGEPPGRGVRWVRLDGLHVTLRFLGPTPEERIAGVAEAIGRTAAGVEPFRLVIHDAGAFPAGGRPRTLWLGIDDGHSGLADLAARLGDALAVAGWPAEARPFRAHLTLARADGVRAGRETAAALKDAAADLSLESTVDRLILFESVTGGGPARYVERAVARLG